MVSYNPESWDLSPYESGKDRFLESTETHIRDEFKNLTSANLEKLKSLPTLFVIENEEKDTKIGYIQNLRVRDSHILVDYVFDSVLPAIPKGTLVNLERSLSLGKFERSRTHWAIKDVDLFDTLIKHGIITQDQVQASQLLRNSKQKNLPNLTTIDSINNDHVFIVHGHDDQFKNEVAAFIKEIGLTPIILHEQASLGKTIIEKIETYTNVGYAIVLYTACDLGHQKSLATDINSLKPRARQNVVLEHGYLMAKLGRPRVAALVKGNLEVPTDISGLVYIPYDSRWKNDLFKEIVQAGIKTSPI